MINYICLLDIHITFSIYILLVIVSSVTYNYESTELLL